MSFALIRSMIAPMMQQASAEAENADESLCGNLVEVLEQSGEWYRIRTHYQYEGWVREKDLCLDENLVQLWNAAPKQVVLQAHADILTMPKVQGRFVAELTRGALVSPTGETENGWQKVRLCDGREGWTWGAFLGEYLVGWQKSDEEKLRSAIAETALSYLGTQYRWGGKSPLGIDCSGLCSMAYLLNGVIICRDAHIQDDFCMHKIDFQSIKKGDLMFFPGHVAMYLGDSRYVHSTAGNNCHGVVINSLDPAAEDYRADLPQKLLYVGSIF
ncbi:MAG TPA: NlpC/P60 family protein [Caproicibacter sp.]|nr:NlpC/P60 family protein [Caproicibacter sp.]